MEFLETINEWVRSSWPALLTATIVIFAGTNAVLQWRRSRWQKEESLAKALLNVTQSATQLAQQASAAWANVEAIREALERERERLARDRAYLQGLFDDEEDRS